MFVVNDDMSIYVNRGDIGFFNVTATENGNTYSFKPGDVLRLKVTTKKACEDVVLQKDFAVASNTNTVEISLSEKDTRIGGVISKPVDYWYEVELNPFDNPQTIIGYDDDGAKIFRLFPEGKDLEGEVVPEDIPVVDKTLDATSKRPVENQAIARKFIEVDNAINEKLSASGGTVKGNIAMSGKKITGLGEPAANGDAVNLGYANKMYALGKAYISNDTNLNTVTASGMYRLGGSLTNAPSGASYGQLLVIHGGGDSIAQIAFDFTMARMWIRTGAPAEVEGAGTWTEWAQCYTTAKKPTASDVGARPSNWMPTAADVGARPNSWMPTASDVGARANTWLPTIAEIGAAPAGYGLGENIGNVAPSSDNGQYDANEITTSGWWRAKTNCPMASWWSILNIAHSDNYATQYAFAYLEVSGEDSGTVLKRYKYKGTWHPWEYVNPPMKPDVEYRTTERFYNKPVYWKLVDVGALPNVSSITVEHKISNIEYLVHTSLTAGRYYFPCHWGDTDIGDTDIYVNSVSIQIKNTANWSNFNGYAFLKYTKTTD